MSNEIDRTQHENKPSATQIIQTVTVNQVKPTKKKKIMPKPNDLIGALVI